MPLITVLYVEGEDQPFAQAELKRYDLGEWPVVAHFQACGLKVFVEPTTAVSPGHLEPSSAFGVAKIFLEAWMKSFFEADGDFTQTDEVLESALVDLKASISGRDQYDWLWDDAKYGRRLIELWAEAQRKFNGETSEVSEIMLEWHDEICHDQLPMKALVRWALEKAGVAGVAELRKIISA